MVAIMSVGRWCCGPFASTALLCSVSPGLAQTPLPISTLPCSAVTEEGLGRQGWNPSSTPYGRPWLDWTPADFKALKQRLIACGNAVDIKAGVIDGHAEMRADYAMVHPAKPAPSAVAPRADSVEEPTAFTPAPILKPVEAKPAGPANSDSAPAPAQQAAAPGQAPAAAAATTGEQPVTGDQAVATASTAQTERDTSEAQPGLPPWIGRILLAYFMLAGLALLPLVRPPLIGWYQNQAWLIFGSGPVDIFLRQIGFRLGFELFIYGVSCLVGALGGWLFYVFRYRHLQQQRRAVQDQEAGLTGTETYTPPGSSGAAPDLPGSDDARVSRLSFSQGFKVAWEARNDARRYELKLLLALVVGYALMGAYFFVRAQGFQDGQRVAAHAGTSTER